MAKPKHEKVKIAWKVNPVLLQVGAIISLALIAYANTFNHGMNLDDFLILENLPSPDEGWKGVLSVFSKAFNRFDYRPVSMLTFAIEQQLQGAMVPGTAHVMNVLYYIICCLVLFVFVRTLPIKNSALLAFATTVLFVVHPIHSNVISSMKNRDSILSLTICLLSLIAILHFIKYDRQKPVPRIVGKVGLLLLGVGLFYTAIITKMDSLTMIVILPIVLLLFWKHWWTFLFGGGIGFILFKGFEFVRYKLITPNFLETTNSAESTLITENPMIVNDAVGAKISTALVSIFYYLKFHLIPKGYYYYFGFDMIDIDQMWTWQNLTAAFILLMSGVFFFYFLRKKPEISLAIAFFFGGLTYCMNIVVPIAGIVAPRLAFIASVGFCMILAILTIEAGILIHRKQNRIRWNPTQITYGLLGLIVLFYLPFTIHRNSAWKDIYTLIERDNPHVTRSFEAQRIASMNYLRRAESEPIKEKSFQYWQKCLDYGIKASAVYDKDQFVEEAIGIANFRLGNHQSSYIQFKKVLENFDTTEIANEMVGDLFIISKKPDSAVVYYEKLIHTAPNAQIAYIKYTKAMIEAGRVEEGIQNSFGFARKYPQAPYMLESIGYLKLIKGDTLASADFLFKAMSLGAPEQGYISVLRPYFERNGLEDSWQHFQNGNVKSVDELLLEYDAESISE